MSNSRLPQGSPTEDTPTPQGGLAHDTRLKAQSSQVVARSVLSKRESKLALYRMQRDELNAELKTLNHRRKKIIGRLRDIGNAIYDLLHESSEVPSVADHAVVRYLERVKGMDIRALKIEIAHHKQAQREGNVIVTVKPEVDDEVTDLITEGSSQDTATPSRPGEHKKQELERGK